MLLGFFLLLVLGVINAKRRRCTDDCSQQICGKYSCKSCTSASVALDVKEIAKLTSVDDMKAHSASVAHLTSFYERPEGVCYSSQSDKGTACITDKDCANFEMCLNRYVRVNDGNGDGIDWTSEKSFCVAVEPVSEDQSTPSQFPSLTNGLVEKDRVKGDEFVDLNPDAMDVDTLESKMITINHQIEVFEKEILSRLPLRKVRQCIHDCSKAICGESKCKICTAYPVATKIDTPVNVMYFDTPGGVCYNEPPDQFKHCEEDSDCELWQLCMSRYSKVATLTGFKVDWTSEKKFCIDVQPKKNYQENEKSSKLSPNIPDNLPKKKAAIVKEEVKLLTKIEKGGLTTKEETKKEIKLDKLEKKVDKSIQMTQDKKEKAKLDEIKKVETDTKFSSGANSFKNLEKYLPSVPRPTRIPLLCPKDDIEHYDCKGSVENYPSAWSWSYPYHRLWDKAQSNRHGDPVPPNKYYLTIMAIFKNEEISLEEWLAHHIGHGVEHFYLIDDWSTDNSTTILKPYIEKNFITMYSAVDKSLPFRQTGMYKKMFLDVYTKNEAQWIAIIDVDEFLYSPQKVNIQDILKKHEDLSVIGVNWLVFGSSGLEHQPKSIIQSFTHRAADNPNKHVKFIEQYKILKWSDSTIDDWQKSIVNTKFKVEQIEVHVSDVEGIADNLSIKRFPNDPPLILNHYIVQSHDFFTKVKATRGDVNNWVPDNGRDESYFKMCDINEVYDARLKDQNEEHGIAMMK